MPRCLSTLVELDEEGYSAAALKRLSDGRVFPARLPFTRAEVMEIRAETVTGMSISGVQEKISLRLRRGRLSPVEGGAEYLLKPIPGQILPAFQQDVPANEQLTMLLASQVFGIDVAANACIRLADDELAYITRRFDRRRDGTSIAQEDFCQLLERTSGRHGRDYKYGASYEEIGRALKRYCSAYAVEVEKLYRRILVNFVLGNGDAHLKNFSLHQAGSFGDYLLTPAYDLLCTTLHFPSESRLALDLFADDDVPPSLSTHGFLTNTDFLELAHRFGMDPARAALQIQDILRHADQVPVLIERSFLSPAARQRYKEIVDDRVFALQTVNVQ